jgi:hypothetical protein
MSKKSIDERLKAHPILQGRIEAILDRVQESAGEIERADEAGTADDGGGGWSR